jgi:hypothetical protein
MKACQLKELCNRTDGFHGVSKKPKPELIKELMSKHPEANKAPKRKWTDADLPAAKKALLSPLGRDSKIIDQYNDHYGFLDQIDKDFYKICNPTNNHTWRKTYGVAMVSVMVRNVWALYEEAQLVKQQSRSGPHYSGRMKQTHNRLIHYIGEMCDQIGYL